MNGNKYPNRYDLVCILEYIDKHLSENIQVLDISKVSFLSPSTIERRFKKYLNITPLEFIHKRKMLLAAELLRNGESVLNTGMNVGYSDNSYFINVFKRYHGITPFEYKKINVVSTQEKGDTGSISTDIIMS